MFLGSKHPRDVSRGLPLQMAWLRQVPLRPRLHGVLGQVPPQQDRLHVVHGRHSILGRKPRSPPFVVTICLSIFAY